MIKYEWREELSASERSEVDALVAESAGYDDEAGFSTVRSDATAALIWSGCQGRVRAYHLLVRLLPGYQYETGLAGGTLVAYLLLNVADTSAEGLVQFVVRPEARSTGIATLTLERVGLPGREGEWSARGARWIRAWAHGNHPAAERMARRFGASNVRRFWRLVRPLGGEQLELPSKYSEGRGLRALADGDDRSALERVYWKAIAAGANEIDLSWMWSQLARGLAEVMVTSRTDGRTEEVGGFVCIGSSQRNGAGPSESVPIRYLVCDPDLRSRGIGHELLTAALRRLGQNGVRQAEIIVDVVDAPMVRLCRKLGFEHDRSDVCYVM